MTSRNTHETTTVAMSSTSTESALLQTAKAVASSPKSHMTGTVRLLCDGGSQRSYVTEDTRQRLQLPTHHQERLKIEGFGGNGVVATNADVVVVEIHSLDGTSSSVSAIVVPKVASSINNLSTIEVMDVTKLAKLRLAEDWSGGADIDILIGADFYWKLADVEIVRCAENLVAMSTKVGWILSGSLPVDNKAALTTCMLSTLTEKLFKQLEQFWDLESLGIKETDPALARFNESIEFDGENYVVGLPWKEVHPMLPDNFQTSKRRLNSLMSKQERTPRSSRNTVTALERQVRVMRQVLGMSWWYTRTACSEVFGSLASLRA